ncbi:hypothetical protein [Caldifermentibacillus hisashii]|uniref:hypothetical protein n=1 Tax=Caldifermentibacillus hisashii TaxID=996558 RepID=UPI003D20B354
MTTRRDLVAKKWGFPCKNDDERGSRRQKNGVSRAKVMTRRGLVAKKWGFPCKNDDEKRSRRQKMGFPGQK